VGEAPGRDGDRLRRLRGKAELAKANGCDHPILYRDENVPERVKEITGGEGVSVVYDSIGKDTFDGSLDCLKPFGLLVSFGNASGQVDPFNIATLGPKGSLHVTRQTLATHTATRALLDECANAVFGVVQGGQVKIAVNQTYQLADIVQAHTDLEARKTTGSTVITP
jgi:NADPH2:quinone reductase